MVTFAVHGKRHEVEVDGNTRLLWMLREHLQADGAKFGSGIAAGGAAQSLAGEAVRSCAMPVSLVGGANR